MNSAAPGRETSGAEERPGRWGFQAVSRQGKLDHCQKQLAMSIVLDIMPSRVVISSASTASSGVVRGFCHLDRDIGANAPA